MEPVFITKNGHGDLAVMSVEAYEKFIGRFELYALIKEGLDDIKAGNYMDYDEFMAQVRGKK
jgi:PHD/YefM family antitoxin component YafN of YafNO toxin-antitoxin module